ncbi:MAG: hypothetical protein ACREXK_10915 [Gammaproteobacteria bacterium]
MDQPSPKSNSLRSPSAGSSACAKLSPSLGRCDDEGGLARLQQQPVVGGAALQRRVAAQRDGPELQPGALRPANHLRAADFLNVLITDIQLRHMHQGELDRDRQGREVLRQGQTIPAEGEALESRLQVEIENPGPRRAGNAGSTERRHHQAETAQFGR